MVQVIILAGPPTTNNHPTQELFVDDQGALYVCTASGTPDTWKKVLLVGDDYGVGAKDLVQVNATIIAGVLIFLTVTAFGAVHLSGGVVNMTGWIFVLAGTVIGFLGGSLILLMLSSKY